MRLTHVGAPPKNRNDWHTIRSLLPYVWQYKNRVILALSCLILAKLANVAVPMFLKQVVDYFQSKTASELMIVVPTLAILGYGLLRFASSALGELRDAVFAKVAQGAVRKVALEVFVHLHSMSLRFHLNRQTGGMTRDIERGTRGISFLLNFMLFNIIPTLVEIVLVAVVLLAKYDAWFAIVTFASLAIYIAFTLGVTEWRMVFRRTMNQLDSTANNKAIDALINYETVKYFGNERFESKRYDHNLEKWETAAVKNQTSLALLNAGQALIIAVGVTILMWLAARGVANKTMTIGDLVLVNAFMIQLYIPLNFLGFVYREIRHSLADMEKMFDLLAAPAEIQDADDAIPLATRDAQVQFQNVHFHYETDREILFGVDFTIPAGKTLAVVGTSGAGKSTLSRLLYRFYDVTQGAILINGTVTVSPAGTLAYFSPTGGALEIA